MLAVLEAENERAGKTRGPPRRSLQQVVARAGTLAARCAGTQRELRALRLIYKSHLQLGDRKAAQQAFLRYADAFGGQIRAGELAAGCLRARAEAKARSTTARTIAQEAERLASQGDHGLALSYCDVLMARYPGSEPALLAQVIVAEHCARLRLPTQSAQAFLSMIRAAPDSAIAMRARVSLPAALANAGRREEAVEAWLAFARASSSERRKASGYCNAGLALAALGPRHYPRAIKLFRVVLAEYPDTGSAELAAMKLASIEKEIERDILSPGAVP